MVPIVLGLSGNEGTSRHPLFPPHADHHAFAPHGVASTPSRGAVLRSAAVTLEVARDDTDADDRRRIERSPGLFH